MIYEHVRNRLISECAKCKTKMKRGFLMRDENEERTICMDCWRPVRGLTREEAEGRKALPKTDYEWL